ncbi:MAG: aromatic amino acid ammonia-lyase, partial [Bacteroidales bacterium]|nr:aromatic amino acid ammonia-lyase [Bacteroidales bacterium]
MILREIEDVLFENKCFELSQDDIERVNNSFFFLESFAREKVIYGINTGFGPMAQYHVNDADLKALQYNIIRSHSTGAGEPFEDVYVKAAMMSRLSTFLKGKSGVNI